MLPALIRRIASIPNSCSAETSRRMASKTSSRCPCLRRSTSWTTTSFSRPSSSTVKHAATVAPQSFMGTLHGGFDILGIVVHAVQDNQILPPPGHEQLAVEHEAEVSGSQERPFTGVIEAGLKDRFGLLRLLPISLCNAGTLHPDFTHHVVRTPREALGVGNHDLLIDQRFAAADHFVRCLAFRLDVDRLALGQGRRHSRIGPPASAWRIPRKRSASPRPCRSMDRTPRAGIRRVQISRRTAQASPRGPVRRR